MRNSYTWNPAVGSDCSSLFLGYYYCVGVPGTPTSKPSVTSVPTTTSPPAGPTPTQTGIISSCEYVLRRRGAINILTHFQAILITRSFLETRARRSWLGTADSPWTLCKSICAPDTSLFYASYAFANHRGSYSWNPAVGTDCANLWLGYYYCVGVRN